MILNPYYGNTYLIFMFKWHRFKYPSTNYFILGNLTASIIMKYNITPPLAQRPTATCIIECHILVHIIVYRDIHVYRHTSNSIGLYASHLLFNFKIRGLQTWESERLAALRQCATLGKSSIFCRFMLKSNALVHWLKSNLSHLSWLHVLFK